MMRGGKAALVDMFVQSFGFKAAIRVSLMSHSRFGRDGESVNNFSGAGRCRQSDPQP